MSAQVSELGIPFAQKSMDGKSNEIPAVQALIEQLEISGCMVVADALNCQKKTANHYCRTCGLPAVCYFKDYV